MSTSLPNFNKLVFFLIDPPTLGEAPPGFGEAFERGGLGGALGWESFGEALASGGFGEGGLALGALLPCVRGEVGEGGRMSARGAGSGAGVGVRGRGLVYDEGGEEGLRADVGVGAGAGTGAGGRVVTDAGVGVGVGVGEDVG